MIETQQPVVISSPSSAAPRWRLATKMALGMGLILIVVALIVAAWTFVEMRRMAYTNLESKGTALAETLNYGVETVVNEQSEVSLQRIIDNSATIEDINRITIVDDRGTVIASSVRAEVGSTTTSPPVSAFLADEELKPTTSYDDQAGTITIVQSLRGGNTFASRPTGNIFGAIEVVLSTDAATTSAVQAAGRMLLITMAGYVLLIGALGMALHRMVVSPLNQLTLAAGRFREGERTMRSQIQRSDEIGILSASFDTMADEVEHTLQDLQTYANSLEQQRTELSHTLDELQSSTEERIRLAETIRELSTPVISLHDHVILLTLIGDIDEERAQQFQESLLEGIEQHNAQKAIIDLTGVPVVDTQVAATLINATRAARLLGAQVIVVGITPQVAQSIVHLGIDFSNIVTRVDLQAGVVYALNSLGFEIVHRQTR
jgi:rsbT co-antagonist protein RsbR